MELRKRLLGVGFSEESGLWAKLGGIVGFAHEEINGKS